MHLTGIGLNWWTSPRGGGYSHFFCSYVDSGPASTFHPPPPQKKKKKKNQEFQAPQINIWNFSNPINILHSVPWPSKKTQKCIEMTFKYSPILSWPPKYIHKIFIPPPPPPPQKKNIQFSEKENIEMQNFEPPKNSPHLRMYEFIRAPPPSLVAGGQTDRRT